jgi:hypothetical protein
MRILMIFIRIRIKFFVLTFFNRKFCTKMAVQPNLLSKNHTYFSCIHNNLFLAQRKVNVKSKIRIQHRICPDPDLQHCLQEAFSTQGPSNISVSYTPLFMMYLLSEHKILYAKDRHLL